MMKLKEGALFPIEIDLKFISFLDVRHALQVVWKFKFQLDSAVNLLRDINFETWYNYINFLNI